MCLCVYWFCVSVLYQFIEICIELCDELVDIVVGCLWVYEYYVVEWCDQYVVIQQVQVYDVFEFVVELCVGQCVVVWWYWCELKFGVCVDVCYVLWQLVCCDCVFEVCCELCGECEYVCICGVGCDFGECCVYCMYCEYVCGECCVDV